MIPVAEPCIGKKELEYTVDAVKSGWVSSIGKYIQKFEGNFAEYCQTKYGVSLSSGTGALHVVLECLGIGDGDEVIVPALTFIATANAVAYTGAKVVLVDSTPDDWCIDPTKIESAITAKTKAIIPVHLYGHPAEMDSINNIARKHNLFVIEDGAEAHGAEYKGRKVGSLGDVGIFSFYGNKIITTGEGGMVVTNKKRLAEKVRLLKDHGMDSKRRYWHPVVGYNYRMTNIQAALGVAQLEQIKILINKKREITELYNSFLKGVEGITLPIEKDWAKNVYWMYSILVNKKKYGTNRDELTARLRSKGIDTRPFFYPINKQPPYKANISLPVSLRLSREGLNLPSSPNLEVKEVKYICNVIKDFQVNGKK